MKRNEKHTLNIWDKLKMDNVRIIRVPEEQQEGKCDKETVVKEIIRKHF